MGHAFDATLGDALTVSPEVIRYGHKAITRRVSEGIIPAGEVDELMATLGLAGNLGATEPVQLR